MTIKQNNRISIESVKTKIIDNLVLYGGMVALFAAVLPLIPFNPEKLNLFKYIDLIMVISIFVIYHFRNRLPLPLKGGIILVLVYLFFITDLYQHGLASTILPVFVFIPFAGIIAFQLRWAAVFYLISILSYAIIAYGYLSGQLSPGLMSPGLNIAYKWIISGVILSLVGIIIAMFVHIFMQSLIRIIKQQDKNYEVLELQDQELKQNIEEKMVLMQEIHHRVKNNLAVVSGLLELQSGLAPDDFSRSALKISTNRILSISKVHELLYQSDDVSRIDFKKYIKELANIIIDSFNKTGFDVELKLDISIKYLNVNHGVPVGIILNELITNSLKHGFKDARNSYQIIIAASEEGDYYKLLYRDNGCGVVESDSDTSTGLGKTLIRSLLTQIEAESQLNTDGMYEMTMKFPKKYRD